MKHTGLGSDPQPSSSEHVAQAQAIRPHLKPAVAVCSNTSEMIAHTHDQVLCQPTEQAYWHVLSYVMRHTGSEVHLAYTMMSMVLT